MVPFEMRMLHAGLPLYLGKTQESLDRLCYVNAITSRVVYAFCHFGPTVKYILRICTGVVVTRIRYSVDVAKYQKFCYVRKLLL